MDGIHYLRGHNAPAPSGRRPRAEHDLRLDETDAGYFSRRASEEHAFAESLENPHTRALHLEIAERYRQLSVAIRDTEDGLR